MVVFDPIVRVPGGVMKRIWEQLIDNAHQQCSQIGGDVFWVAVSLQHCGEEPGRRYEVAALRHVHVDDLAVLVNGALHVPPLIDEPAITDTVPARPCRVDEQRGEALHPPINRHVVNVDAAFGE